MPRGTLRAPLRGTKQSKFIKAWREALHKHGCAPPKKGTAMYQQVRKTYEKLLGK